MMTFFLITALAWANDDFKIDTDVQPPVSEWEQKENPSQGIYDAIILRDITRFTANYIERYRKVRVLSETGKSAVQLFDETGKITRLKGRVVDISGRQTLFDKREDLAEILVSANRRDKSKARVVVPPGLTEDCIVEYTWRIPCYEGIPVESSRRSFDAFWESLFATGEYPVQEPFLVRYKEFHITKRLMRGSFLFPIRFVWSRVSEPATMTEEKDGPGTILVYKNVQPAERYPFGNTYMDKNASRVLSFKVFQGNVSDPNEYWGVITEQFFGWKIDKKKVGKAYKDWVAKVNEDLPEETMPRLQRVFSAFQEKVQSTWLLSGEELEAHKQGEAKRLAEAIEEAGSSLENDELVAMIVNSAFSSGVSDKDYINMVFSVVAKEFELPLHLVIPTSVNGAVFNPASLQSFSLDTDYAYFALKGGQGRWIPLCIKDPIYPPGQLHPRFQGSTAIAADINDLKKIEFIRIPRLTAQAHQHISRYTLILNEEGSLDFTVNVRGTGKFNADFLNAYYLDTPEERTEELKERWENLLPEAKIEDPEFEFGTAPLRQVVLKVKGNIQSNRDDNATMQVIDPFPGSTRPLSLPAIWPPNRTQPLLMPHNLYQVAITTIILPENARLYGKNDWGRENEVGKVVVSTKQEGNMVTVRRDIILKSDLMGADKEPLLRAFLAWMDEAHDQTIAINLPPKGTTQGQ